MSHAEKEITRIMSILTSAIAEHRLPPGTRLKEEVIAGLLEANRNHVRAALRRLAIEIKVVSLVPNKGARVAQPSRDEAKDVFSARLVLEKAVVEQAVAQMSPAKANALLKQLEKEAQAIHANDRQRMIRESGEFHKLIAQISGNRVLAELLEGLITRTSLIIALYQETTDVKCALEEHQRLAQALIDKNPDTAIALTEEHMHSIESHLQLDLVEKEIDLGLALGVNFSV